MAYRKTEKVLAQLEAKRALILACAIDVVGKPGFDGALVEATAARAGVSVGLLYKYFPDRTELFAAVVSSILARDLAAIRERAKDEADSLQALVGAMVILFHRFGDSLASREISAEPTYEKGVRDELARLIAAAVDIAPVDVKLASRAALATIGAMAAAHGTMSKRASAAILFVLRGIGVTEARAQRVIAKGWGLAAAG